MKSIILNDHEAAGVIAGTVTQLRRPIKNIEFTSGPVVGPNEDGEWCFGDSYGCEWIRCPYPAGSKVWVKRTWGIRCWADDGAIMGIVHPIGLRYRLVYRDIEGDEIDVKHWYPDTDGYETIRPLVRCYDDELRWRSAGSLPRRLSRTTLLITSARPQQLKDVTLDDAFAEGVKWNVSDTIRPPYTGPLAELQSRWNADPRNRGHKWEPGLWTWVYRVEVATT